MPTGKQNEFWYFRRTQILSWTKTAVVVSWGSSRGGRGEGNRRDESRWKGRKHEAGMTSLGLTFHSRPTPALCILTSLRCVSYILYPTPPPSSCCLTYGSFFSPLHLSLHIPLLGFFKNNKEEKMRKIVSKRSSNPRLVGPRGCWTLASSHFCQ